MARPVLDAPTGDVPAADGQIGPVVDRGDQSREVGRIVGEVRIHLTEDAGAAREPDGETRGVRGPETALFPAMQDVDPRVCGEAVGDLSGAVG